MDLMQAHENYKAKKLAFDLDQAKRRQQNATLATRRAKLNEAKKAVNDCRAAYKKAAGTDDEEDAMDFLRRAQDKAQAARELVSTMEDAMEDGPHVAEALGLASDRFSRAIVQAEIEKLDPDTLHTLHRAFSVWGGGGSTRWAQFLEFAIPVGLEGAEMLQLRDLRLEVLRGHGMAL